MSSTAIQDNPLRELAAQIVEEFCALLEDKGMKIPSDDREGNEEEAAIYGKEYYNLKDGITKMLEERVEAKPPEEQKTEYHCQSCEQDISLARPTGEHAFLMVLINQGSVILHLLEHIAANTED